MQGVTTTIRQGNALSLPEIPNDSVDLVVTSPPYFAVRVYKDAGEVMDAIGNEPTPAEYVSSLVSWMKEMRRVIKPSGSVFVVLGDKMAGSGGHNNSAIGASKDRGPGRYNQESNGIRAKSLMGLPWRFANACVDDGWILRSEIVWAKPNGMPESVRDRVKRAHETIFHFTKEGDYYSAIDRIRTPYATADRKGPRRSYPPGSASSMRDDGATHYDMMGPQVGLPLNELGSAPGSVWTISTSSLTIPTDVVTRLRADKHYAAFPPEIPRRIITGWSPEGGLVLDPFSGAGTTALVAKVLGRSSISIDLSAGYTRLAMWRVFQSSHAAKLRKKWGIV